MQVDVKSVVHRHDLTPLLTPSRILDFQQFVRQPGVMLFTFVRDPFERALSGYLNKILNDKPAKKAIVATLSDLGETTDEISFHNFLRAIDAIEPEALDNHFKPVSTQILLDRLDYNFIGRFENFEEDFKFLLREIGGGNAPHYLRTINNHATQAAIVANEYRNAETIRLVEKIYAADYAAFGY